MDEQPWNDHYLVASSEANGVGWVRCACGETLHGTVDDLIPAHRREAARSGRQP